MFDRLICIVLASSMMGAGACAKIPWIGPLLCTPAADKVEEECIDEGGDVVGEVLMGHPVDVEVNLDSEGNPICMHCPLHCPKASVAPTIAPVVVPVVQTSAPVAVTQ